MKTRQSLVKIKAQVKRIRWFRDFYRFIIKIYQIKIEKPRNYKFIKNYEYLLEKYKSISLTDNNKNDEYPIWVCWWQGKEGMSDTVNICYHSILKNAGRHKVNLITIENYKNYLEFPDHIMKKIEEGKISLALLSDALRLLLLEKYGGLWLDATIFVSFPIDCLNLSTSFWSPKWKNDKKYYNKELKLSMSIMYSPPNGSIFLSYLKDCLFECLKTHDKLFAYLWYEYFTEIGYENIPAIRKELDDEISFSKYGPYYFYDYCWNEYDEKLWKELSNNYPFHRISHKEIYPKFKKGKLTYYGYLYQEWEREQKVFN